MPKAEEKIAKHTLNLYEGDYRKIQELYPEVGAGAVIRKLVRNHIVKVEASGQGAPAIRDGEIQL